MSAESAELFRSILDAVLPDGGWVIPVWHAYFDESGHKADSKVFVVGGYLIRSDKARRLDKLWRAELRKYKLPYFHMVDCAHGNGVHAALSDDQNDALARRLIQLIKDYADLAIAAVIPPDKFDSTSDEEDIYVHAVRRVLATISWELTGRSPHKKGPVALFFEAGHNSQRKAARVAETHLQVSSETFKSYTFGAKAEFPLLQMADLFVWQLAKNVKDRIEGKRPPRKDYQSLVQHDHFHVYGGRKGSLLMWTTHESPHWETADIDLFIHEYFSDGPITHPDIKRFYAEAARIEREAALKP